MEAYIAALTIYASLLFLSFLALKKNAKQFEKKKALVSDPAQTVGQGREKTQLQNAQSMSRCTGAIYLLKNFTILNIFSKQVPNRSQYLLFSVGISSLYCFCFTLEYPSVFLSSPLLIVVLFWQKNQQVEISDQRRVEKLVRSQVASCICGILVIGVFLCLISLLFRSQEDKISSFLMRVGITCSLDNIVVRPIFLLIVSLGVGSIWPFSLIITKMQSNKLSNQFYRTSESEANVNDTLFIYKDGQQEFYKQVSSLKQARHQESALKHDRKAYDFNDQHPIDKPTFTNQLTRKIQITQQENLFTPKNNPSNDKKHEIKALFEKKQPNLEKSDQFAKVLPTIESFNATTYQEQFSSSKQNVRSQGTNVSAIKRKRRQRKASQNHPEASRIIEIYGQGWKRSEIEPTTKTSKTMNKPQAFMSLNKSENGLRSRPIVHQQYDKHISCKTNFKKFLSFDQ